LNEWEPVRECGVADGGQWEGLVGTMTSIVYTATVMARTSSQVLRSHLMYLGG